MVINICLFSRDFLNYAKFESIGLNAVFFIEDDFLSHARKLINCPFACDFSKEESVKQDGVGMEK